MPRIHCPDPLSSGQSLTLPREASRHIQVLRLQPGVVITLFDGRGGEYDAVITAMGRQAVDVTIGSHHPVEREASAAVQLAVCMPANERMDWLVEKATELGVAHITPLMSQHSVVRLTGERAEKRRAHWEAIAVGACEQCGRNRVPLIDTPLDLAHWLRGQQLVDGADSETSQPRRVILSLASPTSQEAVPASPSHRTCVLIGPEGGFTPEEEQSAMTHGFSPYRLGSRVLRTETAAIAATHLFSQLNP
jgi:16S rRNA (uracil1498-N3)-methyltransferase